MENIELEDIGKEGREEERDQESREEKDREDTSFTENAKDNYDNTRSQINSAISTQSKTDTENGEDIARRLQDLQDKDIAKNDEIAAQRYNAREALESMTGIKFSATHGDGSKNLIDFISDIKYSEKGNLIALKYKGEDVKLTAKGKLDRRSANTDNKKILKAIEDAKVEYEKSVDSAIDKRVGFSVSDEARESV